MNKQLMIGLGTLLILIGAVSLGATVLGWLFGFRLWQLWPLLVIAVGLGLTAPAVLSRRGALLQVLPLLGLPTLTAGTLLLVGSVFRWWQVWTILWPLEVISVAAGCLWIAARSNAKWLIVPAILIGANGLILQFCAATGWWGAWSVLWTVEPVAVGISLLALNARRPSAGLLTAGLVFCALGALGFLQSMAFVSLAAFRPLRWLWRWFTPVAAILAGAGMVAWTLARPGARADNTAVSEA
ncbi:MAG: hypothetical protein JXC32_20015 [Anaerolineae bacterium]|nr:hypothetical protein [Anaerolineae bacterium]